MEFGMANQYIHDITNITGNKTKLEKGELPGSAPLGYLDNLATKQRNKSINRPTYKTSF
jgi:hypothetical protein